jgi:hypothetical protein
MEVPAPVVGAPDCGRRQFSLRSLFALTSAVAIALSISFLCRGSKNFSSLASPWTAVSLLFPVAVWFSYRWQLATCRSLLGVAVTSYLCAMASPALHMKDEFLWGWLVWLQSFWGLSFLFGGREIDGGWLFGIITVPVNVPIQCAIGAVANVAFILSLIARVAARKRPVAMRISNRLAWLAGVLSIFVMVPLCLGGDLVAFYPGFGMWAASCVALALATQP